MKKHVLKQLRAVVKMTSMSNVELRGNLQIDVNGTVDEWDQLLSDLKKNGWNVYRHYVQIGNVSVAILLN